MKRRDFIAGTAALGLAGCAAAGARRGTERAETGQPLRTIKPPRLKLGDTVALICPAGPIDEERLTRAVAAVEQLGFRAKPGRHVLAQDGYNAGTIEQRLADLHGAYRDPAVAAVWAIRGGYGTTQLLPHLDFDLITFQRTSG